MPAGQLEESSQSNPNNWRRFKFESLRNRKQFLNNQPKYHTPNPPALNRPAGEQTLLNTRVGSESAEAQKSGTLAALGWAFPPSRSVLISLHPVPAAIKSGFTQSTGKTF